MFQLLREINPWVLYVMVTPISLVLAAWALRLACSFSSVSPPHFLHALLSVVAIVVAHVAVRYYLEWYEVPSGVWRVVVAPLITWAAVVGISVPTGPLSAISVSVFHAGICLLLFFGLAAVGDALLTPLFA